MSRQETRAQRYSAKMATAIKMPFSICTTYFSVPGNVAYAMRTLACFGGQSIHIIGKEPSYSDMVALSGGTNRLVDIFTYSNPSQFLNIIDSDTQLVALELTEEATSIHEFKWDYDKHTIMCVGSEMDGIPADILAKANSVVYIPMPGQGYCLNTSQSANIAAYDYVMKSQQRNK